MISMAIRRTGHLVLTDRLSNQIDPHPGNSISAEAAHVPVIAVLNCIGQNSLRNLEIWHECIGTAEHNKRLDTLWEQYIQLSNVIVSINDQNLVSINNKRSLILGLGNDRQLWDAILP